MQNIDLVISLWERILENLEDCWTGTLIDYSKALNQMSFQECLRSFARHGTSTQAIALVATFLSSCRVSVKVGTRWSVPRPVNGWVHTWSTAI